MPITSVSKDPATLTMTVVADFPVPVQRLWDAYADPRQLELFWGPPTYPAQFTRHDMYPGGRSDYVMTGPDGDESRGYWEWLDVQPLQSFEVRDGFADTDGAANQELPSMRMVFSFAATDAGSKVTTTTFFSSLEDLDQLVAMGMEQGLREAMSQMDAVLADLATFAAGRACEAQILSDTQVRVSRVIRGTVEQVWAAHHESELMQRWLLGPDGWTMPVCEVAVQVGDSYRYEWESDDGSQRFGFTGVLLDSAPPHRAVTTEQMIGIDGPPATNEMTLTEVEGGTLLSLVITYPSAEVRDMVLATGMTSGMETSYARLEEGVLQAA
ncbi:MAG TPA: SRPBCC family protein [Motilibacterales bacterium]|nr:SRPBCC family protein [Motilibacterales bacterium]